MCISSPSVQAPEPDTGGKYPMQMACSMDQRVLRVTISLHDSNDGDKMINFFHF